MGNLDRSVLRSTSAHVLVDTDHLDTDRLGGEVAIDDDTEHHLRRVLRLRDRDAVSVTDGQGRWCLAVVIVDGNALRLEATAPVVVEPAPTRTITIAAAMPKGDRLDWMVQKVTELGVDRLVLLHAEHSVVRWKPDRAEHQLARLQRIADEALRQSRRVLRMTIDAPVAATDVLGHFVVAEPGGRTIRAGDTAVAVGPEGGWSASELAVCRDRIDLGPTILRTETAAVAVSTLCVASER
jgi:16S rRNA (uracil1498-N3)-methyltransferase